MKVLERKLSPDGKTGTITVDALPGDIAQGAVVMEIAPGHAYAFNPAPPNVVQAGRSEHDDYENFYVSGEGLYRHRVGDENCNKGWCGGGDYPTRCECGGLIHADFGDESYNGDYWLYRKCDRCGEAEG